MSSAISSIVRLLLKRGVAKIEYDLISAIARIQVHHILIQQRPINEGDSQVRFLGNEYLLENQNQESDLDFDDLVVKLESVEAV